MGSATVPVAANGVAPLASSTATDFNLYAQPRSCSARDAPNGNRDGCAPKSKTGTLREIQTADAAARNHPADGEIKFALNNNFISKV